MLLSDYLTKSGREESGGLLGAYVLNTIPRDILYCSRVEQMTRTSSRPKQKIDTQKRPAHFELVFLYG